MVLSEKGATPPPAFQILGIPAWTVPASPVARHADRSRLFLRLCTTWKHRDVQALICWLKSRPCRSGHLRFCCLPSEQAKKDKPAFAAQYRATDLQAMRNLNGCRGYNIPTSHRHSRLREIWGIVYIILVLKHHRRSYPTPDRLK